MIDIEGGIDGVVVWVGWSFEGFKAG